MVAEATGRKAPYAPITALREFFERMRDMTTPQRVDRRFIQKMNVASNNEWALLSALKFLGVVDERGAPTHAYRLLQTTDRFQETLAHLVRQAYADLFASGVHLRGIDDLRDYFRLTSSPSQARNAARFFREVCDVAGIDSSFHKRPGGVDPADVSATNRIAVQTQVERDAATGQSRVAVLNDLDAAKIRLLDKLPAFRADWSPAEYVEICRNFVLLVERLDRQA